MPFICSKSAKKQLKNVPNIFKVNYKDTKMTYGAAIVNFEHILHFILLLILVNSSK